MSSVLLLGDAESHVIECCDALVALGYGVLVVAPEILDQAGSAGVAQVAVDPASVVGRGQIGDLIRQRGPFDAVLQCVPAAAAPFAVTGLDEDEALLAAMALTVSVAKGLLAVPPASGATRLVTLRQATRPEALDHGVAGFLAGLTADHGAGEAVQIFDLLNADGDWSEAGLRALLAPALTG